MQMTKAVVAGIGALAVATLTAAQADAATAYMGGLFGGTPGYSTITGPNGERVNTSWTIFGGDQRISWNNISQSSAERAQIAWLEAHQDEQNTLWVYSASANSINKVANERPELFANTTVISIAPPRPGNPVYQQVQAPSEVNMYQVIADGDSVADEDGRSFGVHLWGYRNLDMQTEAPASSEVLEGTDTTRSYYRDSSSKTAKQSTAAAEVKEPTHAEQRRAARAERVEARKAARAERAEARKAARAERAEQRRAARAEKQDEPKVDTSDDTKESDNA